MTTDYHQTFITVAEDCPVRAAEVPPARATPTVAQLHHELLSDRPYALTSDQLLVEVYMRRNGIPAAERDAAHDALFSTPQACLRASPLAKRYGWGIHHDADGHVALVALGSARYDELASDPSITQLQAMRSTRR